MIQQQAAPETTLDQRTMPFLESLLREKQSQQTSFHMPGHKGIMAPEATLLEYWGGDLHPADLVEINGIIDYLHSPKGTLLQAQQLAAQAYGADHTFFLINGSTVGNMGSVMSASSENDKVIMPRASHRSVYSGVVLSGAMPLYIAPDYHPQVGFPLATDAAVVQKLLEENSSVTAVHITSPNYYGYLSDTAAIRDLAHRHGAVLLVDEAHGSHLSFHEGLPASAVHLRADMIIQSTHKTQSALTQASMLHVNEGQVNLARVAQVMALLQSSSPSSILLASLDAARMQMATKGHDWLDHALRLATEARAAICAVDGLWCYGEDLVGSHGIFAFDPTKLVIRVADLGISGFEVAAKLRKIHKIDVEFADLKHVICSITIGDTEQSIEQLLSALQTIAAQSPRGKIVDYAIQPPAGLPRLELSPREAYFAASERVSIEAAVGQISAENIIPYPPGIPLIVPGEVIDRDVVEYLQYIVASGSGVVGPEDKTLQTIRIVNRRSASSKQ